jgi:hypothetical protein
MQLPPGKWSLSSVTNGLYDGAGATFRCWLAVNGVLPEPPQAVALGVTAGSGGTRATVFAPQGVVDSTTASTVVLRCNHEQEAIASAYGPDFGSSRITAIRADSLDVAAG